MTADITTTPTPPAAAALLLQAIAWPEDAAVTPYCGCAHSFDGLTDTDLETRHLAAMVAPGAVHARAAVGASAGKGGVFIATNTHEIVTAASGGGANDVIKVSTAFDFPYIGATFYSISKVALSSDNIVDAPATSKKRQIELQTLDVPYVEPMSVTLATSFSVAVSQQLADLEIL